jgi:hypothetical protein
MMTVAAVILGCGEYETLSVACLDASAHAHRQKVTQIHITWTAKEATGKMKTQVQK